MWHMPRVVWSADSPWLGYVSAVYGSVPPLPLNLSTFHWFYHRHSKWPLGVEWPMPTCFKNGTVAGHWPPCAPAVCARWRERRPPGEDGPGRSYSVAHFRDGVSSRGSCIFRLERTRFASAATSASEEARVGAANTLLGHAVQPSGRWVEVYRRVRSREGTRGYGCWFFPARGSGIWLWLGRTFPLHYKHNVRALMRHWEANRTIDHAASAAERRAAPVGESFPIVAAELGLRSVQVQFNFNRQFSEIVVVDRACMWRNESLRACAPDSLGLRVGWYDASTGDDRRIGCLCNDSVPVLNCARPLPR